MTVNEKTDLGKRPLKALPVSWVYLNFGVHGVPPLDLQNLSPKRRRKAEVWPLFTLLFKAPVQAEIKFGTPLAGLFP